MVRKGEDMVIISVVFDDRQIRRALHDGEWYFAVVDVVAALTDSVNPHDAWRCLKQQELAACGVDFSELCRCLAMEDPDGRKRQEEVATLAGIFRIVQSVYSPKAEIFKRWLARVGQERKNRQGYKTDLEMVFSMLEEATTAAIACRQQNTQGLDDDGGAARKGSRIAGEARGRLAGVIIWIGRRGVVWCRIGALKGRKVYQCRRAGMVLHQLLDKIGGLDEKQIPVPGFWCRIFLIRGMSGFFCQEKQG
jgi:prophage antirepressor-like protein